MAAASRDLSVKEWLEDLLKRELKRAGEDTAWMDSDLSRLGEFDPYEWGEGELEDETPVRRDPGVGLADFGAGGREGCLKGGSPSVT